MKGVFFFFYNVVLHLRTKRMRLKHLHLKTLCQGGIRSLKLAVKDHLKKPSGGGGGTEGEMGGQHFFFFAGLQRSKVPNAASVPDGEIT